MKYHEQAIAVFNTLKLYLMKYFLKFKYKETLSPSNITDRSSKMCPLAYTYTYYGGSQLLSNWIWGLLHRKDSFLVLSVTLIKSLRLRRSWHNGEMTVVIAKWT